MTIFKKWLYFSFVTLTVLGIVIGQLTLSRTHSLTEEAFGKPGNCPNWSPSTLTVLGTAQNQISNVWFTGFNGIISQVFYPAVDTPATVDWQFLVGDAAENWVDEEKRDTISQVGLNHPHSLSWNTINIAKNGQYQIQKTIFTDPKRTTLIQQVTLTALKGTLKDLKLYTLYHPALSNDGNSTTGYSLTAQGQTFLIAQNSKREETSALTSSLPFFSEQISSGFVGKSDGWQDLLGGKSDKKMDWTFTHATHGNIAQMAQFDLSDYAAKKSVTFTLVLGFGKSESEALNVSKATLSEDIPNLLSVYNRQWNEYTNHLNHFGETADQQYYLSAMTLKAATDKKTGAMVAGLGNPWGNSNYSICNPLGIELSGGYHLVWPRDLYKTASALIAAGDLETANSALDWLLKVGQKAEGYFLQNSFLDGTPYWTGIQMDETAFPIILAWKLGRNDAQTYHDHIKPAADYLVKQGPWTQQERWEENAGYSPATIAAEIAALVCAADIAKINGDLVAFQQYLEIADLWQAMVENWTFTTTGSIGNGQYFERIDDNGNPNDGHVINISNGGGVYDEREIVDSSFLELVRHGVKAWNDPYILSSIQATDSIIKQTIPGKGDGWFRYNYDGYGETLNGEDYTGSGKGRFWPIFTGERGHFAVASGEKAEIYLETLRQFANESGFIPEQVWDLNSPSQYQPGTPTKSMTPLSWSMAEYISLFASNATGKVIDQPAIVYQRYVQNAYQPTPGKVVDYDAIKLKAGFPLTLYYQGKLADSAQMILYWGTNNWQQINDKPMIRRPDGVWETTILIPQAIESINFAFTNGKIWENNQGRNWNLAVPSRLS